MNWIVYIDGFCDTSTSMWGHSSAGRAPALQAGGQRFDPACLHHTMSGDDSEGVTPVPIPNTEVKPFSADGTWAYALGE